MDVKTLQVLSIAAYCTAGVFLIIAIVFFFVFRIPGLIGFITGRSAKKAVAEMISSESGKAQTDSLSKTTGAISVKTTELSNDQETTELTARDVDNGSVTPVTADSNASSDDQVGYSVGTTIIENPSAEKKFRFEVIYEFCYTSSTEWIE